MIQNVQRRLVGGTKEQTRGIRYSGRGMTYPSNMTATPSIPNEGYSLCGFDYFGSLDAHFLPKI